MRSGDRRANYIRNCGSCGQVGDGRIGLYLRSLRGFFADSKVCRLCNYLLRARRWLNALDKIKGPSFGLIEDTAKIFTDHAKRNELYAPQQHNYGHHHRKALDDFAEEQCFDYDYQAKKERQHGCNQSEIGGNL